MCVSLTLCFVFVLFNYDFILDLQYIVVVCVYIIYCLVDIYLLSVHFVIFFVSFIVLSSDAAMPSPSFNLPTPLRRKEKEVRGRRWLWR